jgi:hypothetical protein
MKALQIAVTVTLAFILAILGGTALMEMWIRAHTLYPSPQNESAFLKSYSPQPLVDKFKCLACYSDSGGGISTAAGKHFVQRSSNYDATFGLRAGQQFDLMIALRSDLLGRLDAAGARVVRQTGNAHEGFRADYVSNNSVGSVSILPIATLRHEVAQGLPQGFEQVTLHLVIDERWYPNGISALEATAQARP